MQTTLQKPSYGTRVLATRINEDTYQHLSTLALCSGYKDTSSFVRDALKTNCNDLSEALNGVIINSSST